MPAACGLEPEGGITDQRDRDAEYRVDLVDFDALARSGDSSEVDARIPGDADRVEAVQFKQAPEHLAHRGKETLARLIAGAPAATSLSTLAHSQLNPPPPLACWGKRLARWGKRSLR